MIVTNGAGHNFPSGTTFIRQLWLEIITTVEGDTIFSSGALNNNGDLSDFYIDSEKVIDPQLYIFNTILYNSEGDSGLLNVGVEDMVKLSDYTLPVDKSKTVNYSIPIPENAQGNLIISARLLFRSFPPFFLRFLGLDIESENIPIFEIDQVSAQMIIQ